MTAIPDSIRTENPQTAAITVMAMPMMDMRSFTESFTSWVFWSTVTVGFSWFR
jgi:hypothetical protein